MQTRSVGKSVRLFSVALLLGVVSLLPHKLDSQVPQADDRDCTHGTILVSIVDKAGKPIMNLDTNSFRVYSKHTALKIVGVKAQERAPRALLAIDVSKSMQESGKSRIAQALAFGIIDAAGENGLALAAFSEQIGDRLEFSTPKDVDRQMVGRIRISDKPTAASGGRTAIFDSLESAIDMFPDAQPNDVIFLISDGVDDKSKTPLARVKTRLLEKRIRVFSVVLSEPTPNTPEEAASLSAMIAVSRDTGGQELTIQPLAIAEGLPRASAIGKYMYALATMYYRIELKADRAKEASAKLKLEATDASGKTLSGVQALYPRELRFFSARTQ